MIAHPADHEPVYEIGWAMTDGTAVATCSVCRHVAYLSSARAALVAEKQGRGGDFVTRDGEPLTTRSGLLSFLRRRDEATAEPPAPRFACRTCGESGPFYVAQQVTNWREISEPWRTPGGALTYRVFNTYLPGTPGPPLAYLCGNCRASCDSLEELVLESAFVAALR